MSPAAAALKHRVVVLRHPAVAQTQAAVVRQIAATHAPQVSAAEALSWDNADSFSESATHCMADRIIAMVAVRMPTGANGTTIRPRPALLAHLTQVREVAVSNTLRQLVDVRS